MTRRVLLYYGRVGALEFWRSQTVPTRWIVRLRRGESWAAYDDGAKVHRGGGYLGDGPTASRAARLFVEAGQVVLSRRFRWIHQRGAPAFAWMRSDLVPARSLRALVEPPVPDPAAETPK